MPKCVLCGVKTTFTTPSGHCSVCSHSAGMVLPTIPAYIDCREDTPHKKVKCGGCEKTPDMCICNCAEEYSCTICDTPTSGDDVFHRCDTCVAHNNTGVQCHLCWKSGFVICDKQPIPSCIDPSSTEMVALCRYCLEDGINGVELLICSRCDNLSLDYHKTVECDWCYQSRHLAKAPLAAACVTEQPPTKKRGI
jgi:hypothetical protein